MKKKKCVQPLLNFNMLSLQSFIIMGGICDGELPNKGLDQEPATIRLVNYNDNPKFKPVEFSEELNQNLLKSTSNNQAPQQKYAIKAQFKPIINQEIKKALVELKKIPLKQQNTKGIKLPIFKLLNFPGFFYEGQWNHKKPHGFGKLISQTAFIEGYFKNGELTCEDGFKILEDGSYYRGAFNNFKFEGEGTFYIKKDQCTYKGQWKSNKPNGFGEENIEGVYKYIGSFKNGKKDGAGTIQWKDGKKYSGSFQDGQMHGKGSLQSDGESYKGQFFKGTKVNGILQTVFYVYSGRFKNDLPEDDNGHFRCKSDQSTYQGHFKEGKKHGRGKVNLQDGTSINVVYENDEIKQFE